MCDKQLETIEVSSKQELHMLINEIPEGTVYSLPIETIIGGGQDDE